MKDLLEIPLNPQLRKSRKHFVHVQHVMFGGIHGMTDLPLILHGLFRIFRSWDNQREVAKTSPATDLPGTCE